MDTFKSFDEVLKQLQTIDLYGWLNIGFLLIAFIGIIVLAVYVSKYKNLYNKECDRCFDLNLLLVDRTELLDIFEKANVDLVDEIDKLQGEYDALLHMKIAIEKQCRVNISKIKDGTREFAMEKTIEFCKRVKDSNGTIPNITKIFNEIHGCLCKK